MFFKGFNISGEIKQTYKKQFRCKLCDIDSMYSEPISHN